jgi:hypothetical protein
MNAITGMVAAAFVVALRLLVLGFRRRVTGGWREDERAELRPPRA